jgi:hypothetical protein
MHLTREGGKKYIKITGSCSFSLDEESISKGHFVICFLSFLLERTLEFKLNEKNIEYSPDKIKEALNSMNYSEIKYNNESLFIKMNSTKLSNKILKSLSIKPFKNQLSSKELTTQF